MRSVYFALSVGVVIVFSSLVFVATKTSVSRDSQTRENNVFMEKETQVIAIDAKGGYLPKRSVAKANIPTIIRFNTEATFDCSSSVRIPSKNISQVLPQSGSTDIDIGTPPTGPLQGTCGMGMYPFEVMFE